ncbi:MAG: uroporphyrinogen decarboxylase family protein [Thermoproteota archaeon]
MDSVDRVLSAINIEEADKIPKGELDIHREVIEGILGRAIRRPSFEDQVKVRQRLHIDIVNTGPSGPRSRRTLRKFQGHPIYKSPVGEEFVVALTRMRIPGSKYPTISRSTKILKHAISSIEEMRKFSTLPIERFNADSVRHWVRKSKFAVFAQVGGGFDSIYPLMGLERFVIWCMTNPHEVMKLAHKVARFHTELAKLCVEAGAHVILLGDDLAYNKGTFLPPEKLRKLIFPFLGEEVRTIKRLGVPVILHSDGNISEILEDIVAMGFDGIHSIQPSSGMVIGQIKKRYGDKLCLMGNIDLDHVLPLGTREEVVSTVKQTIKEAAPGGGYILSSTNVLTRETPAANAIAMYETAEKYGRYPIIL